jgi:outer membrane protein TolC
MDMVTLAAILGHSKLNMVTRYAHPQEKDKADAMNRLEKANAAAEIAEFERLPTISLPSKNRVRKAKP